MDLKIALTSIVKSFIEPLSYIYDDEDESILELLMEQVNSTSPLDNHGRRAPRLNDYVEHIVPSLSSVEFQQQFRYALLYFVTYPSIYIICVYREKSKSF